VTYEELLAKIIDAGIEAARADYGKRGGENTAEMLRGAIDGFEACRGKQPLELAGLWNRAERQGHYARGGGTPPEKGFWYWRAFGAEIEWIANVVSVGLQQQGLPAILPWLPTARGAIQYAKIVGVAEAPAP